MFKCCAEKYYKDQKYFFKEDTVSQGCVLFRADHEEEVERLLIERNPEVDV